jgi:hypothetical protein
MTEKFNAGVKSQSQVVKDTVMKKLAGGWCCICGGIPTLMVTYEISDEKQGATRLGDSV